MVCELTIYVIENRIMMNQETCEGHPTDVSTDTHTMNIVTPKGVLPPALCHASATREGP